MMEKYKAFISHSSTDSKFCERLYQFLVHKGLNVWLDKNNIEIGHYWMNAIEDGLNTSQLVIGVLSHKAMASKWVRIELDYAFRQDKYLFLIRLEPIDLSKNIYYSGIQYLDCFTEDAESTVFEKLLAQIQQTISKTQSPSQPTPPNGTDNGAASTEASVQQQPQHTSTKTSTETHKGQFVNPREAIETHLMRRVENYWIRGIFEKVTENFRIINPEFAASIQHLDYGPHPVADLDTLYRCYLHFNELLILGAPGAGKTTKLLELCKFMLKACEDDPKMRVPVVLNLSSWTHNRNPLDQWIINELVVSYQLNKDDARHLLENNRLIYLLDGLDEVAEEHRNAMVNAINAFKTQYMLTPIIVCSRITDYDLLTNKLDIKVSFTLQPLTDAQLNEVSRENAELDKLLQTDIQIKDMARVPFNLSIMYQTANMIVPHKLLELASIDKKENYLLQTYIETRFHHRHRFTQRDTLYYLSYLAAYMYRSSQSIFVPAHMQMQMLKMGSAHSLRWYFIITRIFSVVVIGLSGFVSYYVWLSSLQQANVVLWSIVGGLALGTITTVMNERFLSATTKSVAAGLLSVPIAFPLVRGLGLSTEWNIGIIVSVALFLTFVGFLIYYYNLGGQNYDERDIMPIESLYFVLGRGLMGYVVALSFAILLFLLITRVVGGLPPEFWIIAFSWTTIGLTGGFTAPSNKADLIDPTWGIRQSLWYGMLIFIGLGIATTITGMVTALLAGEHFTDAMFLGLFSGLFVPVLIAMFFGFFDVFKHYTLRWLLKRDGLIPRDFITFLDFADKDVNFLRRSGGSYIFLHRTLRDYFARQWEDFKA